MSSLPFINLAQSIQFEIDPNSPVISVEKDFLETAKKAEAPVKYTSLNSVVGKPFETRSVAAAKVQTPKRPVLDYSMTTRGDSFSQRTISGPLELKQGLALTDEHRIEIHQENKGNVIEFGDVDIIKGTYAIKLSSNEGHVCARLRGGRSEIIGEGCFSLDRIKGLNKSTAQGPLLSVARYKDVLAFSDKYKEPLTTIPVVAKSLNKEVAPKLFREAATRPSTKARVIDFYDYDNPDAKNVAAAFETMLENREDAGSTVVTTIVAANHPRTRMVSNKHTSDRGAMIPNRKAYNALNQWATDAGRVIPGGPSGTAWGRAMNEGKAVAGAEVEVEGREDIKPLYLNEFYIPDPNQKSTASHGLYTIMGLADGEYSLRANRGNQFMGFQNISVRENQLSLADIDATERKRTVRIATYDFINKTSQGAVVTLQNYEEDVVVESGQKDVNVQDNYDTAYALVNPLNKKYMTAQFILNPGEELYNFPMVPSDWVEGILSQAKLERPVRNKVVLGIGSEKPFRVEAVGSKTAQVVYFDSEGQVLGGKYGTAGGGFLILDPEDEVTEFAIQAAGEKTVRAVYMPTISNVLNVIQL